MSVPAFDVYWSPDAAELSASYGLVNKVDLTKNEVDSVRQELSKAICGQFDEDKQLREEFDRKIRLKDAELITASRLS